MGQRDLGPPVAGISVVDVALRRSDEERADSHFHSEGGQGMSENWINFVKFLRKRRSRGELEQVNQEFSSGRLKVDSPELVPAAIAISAVDIGKKVPPPPTEQQLAKLDDWISEVIAEHRRSSQNERWARELRGLPRNSGNGKAIGPMRLQKSRYGRDELLHRLQDVIKRHNDKLGEFERRYLDPHFRFYIPVKDGGISNKQVVLLAGMIVGNNDERSFEENWKIVSGELEKISSPQQAAED
jgi:hypothetical protein